jgi:hypothetical protein
MTPSGVSKTGSAGSERKPSPRYERETYLAFDQFLVDPTSPDGPLHLVKKWKEDRAYRLGHTQVSEIAESVARFINRDSSMTAQTLEASLKKWYEDPKFKEDPINIVVLANIRRVLAQFQAPDNTEPAQQVAAMLPPVETPKAAEAAPSAAPSAAAKAAPPPPVIIDPKKNLAIGLELENDTIPLAILDVAGIPVSTLATERAYFTLKPSVEFPLGDWVGLVRLRGGTFQSRGIPGENNETGTGYRLGLDWGLVNPYSPSHERSGMGFEFAGISGHAGQANGIEAPGPVVRLRFWRQSDWNFPIGDNFELGFSSFLNNQETHLPLANDVQLSASGGTTSPLATTNSLFARSSLTWFNVSGRYYLNGRPDRDTAVDKSKPFRPGEGGPMISNLWTGQVINLNLRRNVPVFSNTQVLMGTFWPLGMESSLQQFDTISTGLVLFSGQDGYNMARNAQLRGEIWRRDDSWLIKGLMLGGDALYLGYNVIRVATAESDPPTNQTMEEFQNNPGSVTDFDGRAARLNLMTAPFEYGLSIVDASGIAGNVYDEDRTKYFLTSGVAAGLGFVGFLFSGPLTGNGCAEDGPGGNPVLLRCSFPAQRDKYFKTGINATPDNMRSIENQYAAASVAAGATSWGVTRLLAPLSLSFSKPSENSAVPATRNTAVIQNPHLGVSFTPNGGQINYGGNF